MEQKRSLLSRLMDDPDDDPMRPNKKLYDSSQPPPTNPLWTYRFWIVLAAFCTTAYFARDWFL